MFENNTVLGITAVHLKFRIRPGKGKFQFILYPSYNMEWDLKTSKKITIEIKACDCIYLRVFFPPFLEFCPKYFYIVMTFF